jgi:putative acetyltransferase
MPELLPPQVAPLRQASRQVVRELGFLDMRMPAVGVTPSEGHVLIELEQEGTLTAAELATRLNLDKSTLSRTLARLRRNGWVEVREGPRDRRRKPLALRPAGKRQLTRIHLHANAQVVRALSLLQSGDRDAVVRGMALYGRALAQVRAQARYVLRPIAAKDDPEVARVIRTVMAEMGAIGPGYSVHDPEVSAMSRTYRGGRARYLVVVRDGRVVGGAGFGPLRGGPKDVAELRKMYVLADARGAGLGRRLLEQLLPAMARAGYRRCYLETLESMVQARRLYESLGFVRRKGPLGQTGHHTCDAWYERRLY